MLRAVSSKRATRRTFLGASAAALLLTACGGAPAAPTAAPAAGAQGAGAKPPADAAAKPADAAKPAAGGTTAPAAAAPVQAAAKGLVLEMTFPDWIIDVNPAVQKLSDEYSQTTGVRINVSKFPPDINQKVQLEANSKKSSWHGIEGFAAFQQVAVWEESDALAPWDGLITKEDFEDLLPTAKQEMTYKGKLWLFPYRVSPIGLGWRPKVYQEVGLPAKPPTSWDEFFANAEKIEKAKSTPDKKFYGNVTHLEPRYVLYSLIQSLVKDPYDYDKGLIRLDQPEVPQAMELMKRLATISPPDSLRSWNDSMNVTSTGQMGQVVNHLLTMFRAKKPLNGDMQTAAFPKLTHNRTNYWSSGPMILKYGNQVEESARYWLWLSKQKRLYDEMWVVNGSPPNRKSIFKEFEPQKGKELDAGIWDTIAQQEQSPPMPNSLFFPLQHTVAFEVMQDFVAEKIKTPQEAIATINKRTDEQIAKQKK